MGWVAHKILVTAQSPNSSFPFLFDFGLGTWDLDSGFSILQKHKQTNNKYFNIRMRSSVKSLDTKNKIFNWKTSVRTTHSQSGISSNLSSSDSSAVSTLRAASSPSSTPPPISTTRSRSPRTPRSRGVPRVLNLGRIPSPERDRPPRGSPRASRIDTPPRSMRQYSCRNEGCVEVFQVARLRVNHENNSCRFRAQVQVSLMHLETRTFHCQD